MKDGSRPWGVAVAIDMPSEKTFFVISRDSRTDVLDQLADGLRRAILSGAYRAGDVLPTMKEIAAMSGVSFKTARRAIERLTEEGLVNPRPRIGSVVMPRNVRMWKGHVLFVFPEEDEASYYVNMLSNEIRRRLIGADHLFSRITASRRRTGDRAQLESMLRQSFDFAIVMYDSPYVVKRLEKAGIPYVVIASGPVFCGSGCKGVIRFVKDEAINDFVLHCQNSGVRSVTEVDFGRPDTESAAKALSEVGIAVSSLSVRPDASCSGLESVERGAMKTFLSISERKFPDVFLFWDDFVAQGALTALSARGVRIPEDVKIATLSNRGSGPVYVKSLSCIEHDPSLDGDVVSQYVLACLSGRKNLKVPVLRQSYRVGETFPVGI